MPIDRAQVEQLRLRYEQAQALLLQEDGERFRIIMRDISEEEKQRILDGLSLKHERVLFGLEAPEERRGGGMQPGRSGGNLTCEICQKTGLTERGLRVHKSRVHGIKAGTETSEMPFEASESTEGARSSEEGASAEDEGRGGIFRRRS